MSTNNNSNNEDKQEEDECESIIGYSLLIIRFDIDFADYEPPGFPLGYYGDKFNTSKLAGNLANLFDTSDVSIIVYAAKTGRRIIIDNIDDDNKDEVGNVDSYSNNDNPDNYYEKYLTMAEAYELSQNGLRTCVPNNVCLMVGISKIHSNDYSVTMYHSTNTNTNTTANSNNNDDLLDNDNTTTSNNKTTTISSSRTSIIPGVLYREGKKFPYFFASDSITFTQIDGAYAACQSSCPLSSSPNRQGQGQNQKQQSLLEFDYWTGEVVTSPYWTVMTTNTNEQHPNDHDLIDRITLFGCGYNCNYPTQRLIRETICLDHTSFVDENGKYIDTDNSNSNTDYLSTATNKCYEFFLATNNHWDPLSYISPSFRLRYNGIVLRDEVSFQFVSVPLGTTGNNEDDLCVRSYNCLNKEEEESSHQQQVQVPFDFFLYRPYSQQNLNWELRDRIGDGDDDDDDNNYVILNGTLPRTHIYNSSAGNFIPMNSQPGYYQYYADDIGKDNEEEFYDSVDIISDEESPSNDSSTNDDNDDDDDSIRFLRRKQRGRNLWQKHQYHDYTVYEGGGDNYGTSDIADAKKILPIHVRKCIPIERVHCLSFKIYIDDGGDDDEEEEEGEEIVEDYDGNIINGTDTDTDTTTTSTTAKITKKVIRVVESDPYQIKLNDVTYRHAFYWLGDDDNDGEDGEAPKNEYDLLTGGMWPHHYEKTLMGRSCNHNPSSVNHSSSSSYNDEVATINTTTNDDNRNNNNNNNNVCNPMNESLFQFDFHTIKTKDADDGIIDKSLSANFFDFVFVGRWWEDYWNRIYYIRDVDYFGHTYLFDQAYTIIQCVPKDSCLGLELMYDVGDGEGFPLINSTYNVSRNGVLLNHIIRKAELAVSDHVWTTPYGCLNSSEVIVSSAAPPLPHRRQSLLSTTNSVDILLIVTMFGIITYHLIFL